MAWSRAFTAQGLGLWCLVERHGFARFFSVVTATVVLAARTCCNCSACSFLSVRVDLNV